MGTQTLRQSWEPAEYTLGRVSECSRAHPSTWNRPTFGEEASVIVDEMATEKPSIAEFVVSFDQLDPVALGEAQLIGAAGLKVICGRR